VTAVDEPPVALEKHLQLMLLLLPLLPSLGATRCCCCRLAVVEVVMEQQIFLQGGRSNEGEGKVVGDDRLRGPETSSREQVAATAASMVRAGTGKGMYRSRRRRASWGLVFVPGQNVFLFFCFENFLAKMYRCFGCLA